MNKLNSLSIAAGLLCIMQSCGSAVSPADLKREIVGKYALQEEDEFDHIRDTIEIKANDKGAFDVGQVRWSSAKVSDPGRPVNKVAGQWNNNSGSKIRQAEFQPSDTTLRITEAGIELLNILKFDITGGTLNFRSYKGGEKIYHRVK